jgi:RimJ/RimL family protein N-acetyltransferase
MVRNGRCRCQNRPWPGPLSWPPEALTDGVAALDRMILADAEAVAEACADPEAQRWLPLPDPYTLDDARTFIGGLDAAADLGERLNFALWPAGSRALAGSMGIAGDDLYPRGVVGLGYWTAPRFRGRGLTWRGLRLAAAWAAAILPDLRRIEVLVQPANTASRRVAARAGARFEGVRRDGLFLHERGAFDAAVYAFLPGEVASIGPAGAPPGGGAPVPG